MCLGQYRPVADLPFGFHKVFEPDEPWLLKSGDVAQWAPGKGKP